MTVTVTPVAIAPGSDNDATFRQKSYVLTSKSEPFAAKMEQKTRKSEAFTPFLDQKCL